ncbi:MAG: hypothetical protein LQ337_006290 [Flavoplaca oasis]|nr:MAG: hypothetical protein LQ337_006290 [Flavoplaca oasis]
MLVPPTTKSGEEAYFAIAPATTFTSETNHRHVAVFQDRSKREHTIAIVALDQARGMPGILFAFTTAATIFWIFKNRRSGAGAASTPSAAGNTAQEPGGFAPTPTPGFYPEGQAPSHTQSTSSPSQQPQPQMQQSGYSEPMQHSTYPAANQHGSAGEYYNQPQNQSQPTEYPPNRAEMPSPPPQQHGVSPISGN